MSKALVLGGGGIAGISWEVGMVRGLLREGIDLTDADLIVGTSAGSVVGSLIATGADLEQAIAYQVETDTTPAPVPDLEPVMAAFGILFDPTIEPQEARRRVGEMALAAPSVSEEERIEAIFNRLPIKQWPERALKITAVDAHTGRFVVWDKDSGVPLVKAVASSCAVPCVFPPVTIGDSRYIDGGVRSPTSADLAAGASSVLVLEPMADLAPAEVLQAELATLGGAKVARLGPDEAALAVFGQNVLDPALWGPAFKAGLEQASSAATSIRAVWTP
jgi:NTE family protein